MTHYTLAIKLIITLAAIAADAICYGSPGGSPTRVRAGDLSGSIERGTLSAKTYPITAMSVAVRGNYTVYANGRAAEVADWCQELRPWGSRKIHVDVQNGIPNWSAIRWLDEGFMWNVYVSGDTPESVREELRAALRALDGPPRTYEGEWDE